MIFCEFNYCIYNKKGECILTCISISPIGMCEECIIPTIDDETLNKYKNETLNRLKQKLNNKSKKSLHK